MTVDEMQFCSMPERGTIDAVFMLKRMQEEHHAKKKLHICSADLEKAFDRVPRKVLEWALRKNGTPEVLVRSAMRLYEEQRHESKLILSCQMSLRLKWGCTKDLCCHLFFLQ